MRSKCPPFLLVVFILCLASWGLVARAQEPQDRLQQPLASSRPAPIAGTVHPLARKEDDHGPVDASQTIHGITLSFSRSTAQQNKLGALLKAQQDPSSPSYRKWLTAAQFADTFGMSEADIAKVNAWLRAQGFTIDKVADSRTSIRFSGTAAQAEQAFQTQIDSYVIGNETHFANAKELSLPASLAAVVTRIGGLDDFKPKPRLVRPASTLTQGVQANFTSGQSGNHFLAPGDFSVLYDMSPLYTAGFTALGQTIGIAGQTDIVMGDITSFRAAAGLPANNPAVYLIPGSADPGIGDASGDINETDLDLEWAGAVAKNATIVLVNSTNVLDSLQYAIENKINGVQIPILSTSYGDCEPNYATAELASLEASFQQANAQGQTIIGPSGDTGAADCDYTSSTATTPTTSATHGLQVDYPGSSAYVTGLGGSEFTGDGTAASPSTGADQYWSANGSNDVLTSALSYIPEMGWNDTTYSISQGGGLSAGGGGSSSLYPKPSWQTGVAGIPAANHRSVPDIALNASADHDPYLVCTQIVLASDPTGSHYTSSCDSGFRISDSGYSDDQGLTAYGGTSVAAPSFAGMLAVLEQKLGAPQGLGNVNPTLYSLASNATTYASAFHDITTGSNIVPCTANSTGCPTNDEIGYSAGTGYDQVTGLGSVDATKLATAFASVATKAGSSAAITFSPSAPTVGAAVAMTATVTANSGTDVPSGSVTFTIDGASLGAVTIANVTAFLSHTFSTGGPHTVSVSYSGDNNFYESTASTVISVAASASAAPTTTTLIASPATIALGGSLTLTATVQSSTAGTLGGSVTFAAGSTSIGTAVIAPGATGAGTATLTLASATAAEGFSAGNDTIKAAYGGDTTYAASSGTANITVTNPGLTLTIPNMTIASSNPGFSGTSTVTLTSSGGYAGTVTLAASASTLNANYTLAATSLALSSGGTAATTINIQTVAADVQKGLQQNAHPAPARTIAAAGIGLGALCLFLLPGLRRKRWPALLALVLCAAGGVIGCGGSSVSPGASPVGTYTVTVTATDSSNSAITTSTNFTVTIQ